MWIDIGKVSYNYFRIKGSVHNLRLTNPIRQAERE